jgi:hypothetical protein
MDSTSSHITHSHQCHHQGCQSHRRKGQASASQGVHATPCIQGYSSLQSELQYCSVVGKLNYLTQTSRGDIMYATHQIAKYSSNLREPRGEAIIYLI